MKYAEYFLGEVLPRTAKEFVRCHRRRQNVNLTLYIIIITMCTVCEKYKRRALQRERNFLCNNQYAPSHSFADDSASS